MDCGQRDFSQSEHDEGIENERKRCDAMLLKSTEISNKLADAFVAITEELERRGIAADVINKASAKSGMDLGILYRLSKIQKEPK